MCAIHRHLLSEVSPLTEGNNEAAQNNADLKSYGDRDPPYSSDN